MPQQTPLQNYQTAYQKISDRIAALSLALATASNAVDSYSIEGQVFSKQNVFKQLDSLYEQQITLKRLMQREDGPFEVHSYGVV